MTKLIVERAVIDGDIIADQVECTSLSFDGGTLIAFHDQQQTSIAGAWSPNGWLHCRWDHQKETDREVHT